MKKLLFSLSVVSVLFLGCVQNKQENKQANTPKIVSFLSDYIENNPNWNQNDIIKKQINDSLETILSKKINGGLLDSIPMELSEVNEYEHGKYAVNLQHWASTEIYTKNNIEFDLNFNVIGLIDSSLINNIQNKSKYYIKGNFIKFLGRDFNNFINGSVYTPLVEISKPYSDRYEISLGIILVEIKDINLVN